MEIAEGLNSEHAYLVSHLGTIKFFAIWGILEALIYYMTKGDKMKEIIIHVSIVAIISLFTYIYPEMRRHIL